MEEPAWSTKTKNRARFIARDNEARRFQRDKSPPLPPVTGMPTKTAVGDVAAHRLPPVPPAQLYVPPMTLTKVSSTAYAFGNDQSGYFFIPAEVLLSKNSLGLSGRTGDDGPALPTVVTIDESRNRLEGLVPAAVLEAAAAAVAAASVGGMLGVEGVEGNNFRFQGRALHEIHRYPSRIRPRVPGTAIRNSANDQLAVQPRRRVGVLAVRATLARAVLADRRYPTGWCTRPPFVTARVARVGWRNEIASTKREFSVSDAAHHADRRCHSKATGLRPERVQINPPLDRFVVPELRRERDGGEFGWTGDACYGRGEHWIETRYPGSGRK